MVVDLTIAKMDQLVDQVVEVFEKVEQGMEMVEQEQLIRATQGAHQTHPMVVLVGEGLVRLVKMPPQIIQEEEMVEQDYPFR